MSIYKSWHQSKNRHLSLWFILLFSPQIAAANTLSLVEALVDGVGGIEGLGGASAVAISADEQHLYATGFSDNAIVVFSRNSDTGALSFIQVMKNSDIGNNGLQGANAVAISPDDKHVYVAGVLDNAVVVFTRDPATGILTLVEIQQDGVNNVDGLGGASAIAISPDNLRVYVVGTQDNAVSVFGRDVNTGGLTFLQKQQNGVNDVSGLGGATAVVVSNDNLFIYVAANGDSAIAVFARNPQKGEIAFEQVIQGVSGLNGAYDLSISPDSKHVYVVSNNDNAIAAFSRDATSGNLTYLQAYKDGDAGIDGLSGARSLTLSPSGSHIYATGVNDNAIAIFSRDAASGQLNFEQALQNNTNNISTLEGVTAITTSGAYVYTAALFSNAITVFSTISADLQVTMMAPQSIGKGSPLTYAITVTNNGPSQATGITLTDVLPTGTVYSAAEPSQGSCSHDTDNNQVTCELETLVSGATATVTLTVTAPSVITDATTLTNKVAVASGQIDADTSNNSVSTITQLVESVPTADLKVEIKTNLETVSAGAEFVYTVTVTNQGPDPASNVVLTNTLPNTVAFKSEGSDARCTNNAGTLTCQLGELNANSPTDITLNVTASDTIGPITFSSTVTGNESDPTANDNTASKDNIIGELQVDLTLELVDEDANISTTVGNDITINLKATNSSAAIATGVKLTGTLATQLSYVSNTANCVHAQSRITCDIGNLNPNQSNQIGITVRAVQTGTDVSSNFTIIIDDGTDTNDGNNLKIFTVKAITGNVADFVITADDGGKSVLVGNPVTYTVSVTNNGPVEAGATLNIGLSGENVAIGAISGDDCGSGTSFNCTLKPIPVGESSAVTIEATPTVAGNLTLTAELTSNIFDPTAPNIATVETTVSNKETNLNVTMVANPDPVLKEKELTYTITVTNNGPDQAEGIIVTHELPRDVTLVSATSKQGSCDEQSAEAASQQKVICSLGLLDLNAISVINVVVTPLTTGKRTSTVLVSNNNFDSDILDNTVSLETEVGQFIADMSLTATQTPETAVVESPLSYTLTITNQGPDDATNIKLINTLPENVVFQSAKLGPADVIGNCADIDANNEVTCTINTLAINKTATVTIKILPAIVGDLLLTAQVSAREFDSASDNNSQSINIKVNNPSTLFFVEEQRNNIKGVQGLEGVIALAITPDGQHVYAAGFADNALVVFSRNAANGKLQFVGNVIDVEGLTRVSGVSVSQDGAFVYATSLGDNALTVFSRDVTTGLLTLVEIHKDDVNDVDGLAGAYAIMVTENNVYVTGSSDDAIAIFSREPSTGKLTFGEVIRFTNDSQNLDGVNAFAISPDGLHLFATSINSNRLSVFSREPTTGKLSLIQTHTNNENNIQGLENATGVIVSPDGNHVYTVGNNTVTVFRRSPDAGTLSFVNVYRDGLNDINGIGGAYGLTISTDGNLVYVIGRNDNALVTFRRNPETGLLNFVDVETDGNNGVTGLGGVSAIIMSPSNAHIYLAGFIDNAIAVFSIATANLSVEMTDSEDPIKVGNNLIYTITVTNNGPQLATGITLIDTLPTNIRLLSFSQGSCTTSPENKATCTLGSLASGAKLTLTLMVSPIDIGELVNQVTVAADQFDPSQNLKSETTQVVAESDLWLSMSATSEPARIGSSLTYQITITNRGPDAAKNVIFTDELPNAAEFIPPAEVSTDISPCFFDEEKRTINCTIAQIAAGASSDISLVVVPNVEGATLENSASVKSSSFDPDLVNNSATKTIEVLFNLVENTIKNEGKNLHNYMVASSGAIIDGSVSGTIQNQGLISDVWILPDSTVSGGKLSKTITNEGTIENVQLLSGTVINGGILRGRIFGFPTEPATLNTQIAANTQLNDVIIGSDSKVDPTVVLGEGVTFIVNRTIPVGINLTAMLPPITGLIDGSRAVDLSKNVLLGGDSLLDAINAIPELQKDNLVFSQAPDTGNLLLPIDNETMVLLPIEVQQTSPAEAANPRVTTYPDGHVTFITATGRLIIAQPSTQNPTALATGLSDLGLHQFEVAADGNLTIIGDDHLKLRPDLYSKLIDPIDKTLGLEEKASLLVVGVNVLLLRFIDKAGLWREQTFYPTAAHQEELRTFLQGFPGATSVEFANNGKVSVKIDTRTHSAVFDNSVKTGTDTTVTQMFFIPDANGDGSDDIRIIYSNSDQQVLYMMPFPVMAIDIQDIPQVQAANYIVALDINGDYLLTQGDLRLLMKTTTFNQLDDASTLPNLRINPDGSAEFITETGMQIITQPLVQDLSALNGATNAAKLPSVVTEANGNLTITVSETLSYSARPDLESTLTWLGMPLGLHNFPTSLPGVLTVAFVFRDEAGAKRQQYLYPASQDPQQLQTFLTNIPGVEFIRFANDGTITVTGVGFSYRGIFDYALKTENIPTGSIQLTNIADANDDDIGDFAVIYGNGASQIIYQIR